jgi:hypothetical protein
MAFRMVRNREIVVWRSNILAMMFEVHSFGKLGEVVEQVHVQDSVPSMSLTRHRSIPSQYCVAESRQHFNQVPSKNRNKGIIV